MGSSSSMPTTTPLGNINNVVSAFVSQFQNSMLDVSKYIVLTGLFIVMEIVITMTLMKDFAIMIGGESRIIGLGKLV